MLQCRLQRRWSMTMRTSSALPYTSTESSIQHFQEETFLYTHFKTLHTNQELRTAMCCTSTTTMRTNNIIITVTNIGHALCSNAETRIVYRLLTSRDDHGRTDTLLLMGEWERFYSQRININISSMQLKWDGKITKIWYDNEMR